MKFLSLALTAVAALSLAPLASAQCPPLPLFDPNGLPNEHFGSSLDFDGTTLAAGRVGQNGEGGVLIFRRIAGTFVLEAEIESVGGAPVLAGAELGRHVAVDGDRVAMVGLTPDVLAIYVRQVDPVSGAVSWVEEGFFNISTAIDISGHPLTLQGTRVAIGSTATPNGRVYWSERIGGVWTSLKTVTSPAPIQFGRFGRTAVLNGTRLAVSATGEGDVHVFNLVSGNFVHSGSIAKPGGDGLFGHDLAWAGVAIAPKLFVTVHTASVNGLGSAGKIHEFTEVLQPFPNPPIWTFGGTIQAGAPRLGELFGQSISVVEPFFGTSRMVVGAPGLAPGTLHVFENAGSGWQEVRVIEGDDGGVGGNPTFGLFVAHAGTTVAIGHSQHDGPGGPATFDQGAVVIHELLGTSCPLACTRPRMAGSDLVADDESGASVSIEGDTALVGVPRDDTLGADAGVVRVYRKQGDCWYFDSELLASDGAAGDRFGSSVSIDPSGTYAIVGARLKDSNGVLDSGGAYIFFRSGAAWIETDALAPITPRVQGEFGSAVDVQNDIFPFAVVGEPGTASMNGQVHRFLFDFGDGGWNPDAQFGSPLSASSANEFGSALAAGPGIAVVGDPAEDLVGANNGAVHLFRRDPLFATWSNTDSAFGVINPSGERYGESVDTNGVSVVVGAPGSDSGGVAGAGRMHSYVVSSGLLLPKGSTGAGTPIAGAGFGRSVSINGSIDIVVGADESASGGTGAAHVVQLLSGSPTYIGDFIPPGAIAGSRFGTSIDLDGFEAVIGAPFDDGVATATGSSWVFDVSTLPNFQVDRAVISTSDGGTQSLALNLGPAMGGHFYWVVGSASGTSPGIPLPPFVFPLNFDVYYKFTIKHPNGNILQNTLGVLDETGKAQSAFHLPAGAPVLGPTYYHAALSVDPMTLEVSAVSEPVTVDFVP